MQSTLTSGNNRTTLLNLSTHLMRSLLIRQQVRLVDLVRKLHLHKLAIFPWEQYATELGVQEDHLIEALEQTFGPQQPGEPPAEKMVEPQ